MALDIMVSNLFIIFCEVDNQCASLGQGVNSFVSLAVGA